MNLIQIYYENGEWRALIGSNPDEGITGRSDTPVRALWELLFKLNITPWEFEMTPLTSLEEK